MTMNPFEQNEHLLYFLTSQVEREVIDYIRQEMQHGAPGSVPTEEELFAFFQSPDEPTKLDAYQAIRTFPRGCTNSPLQKAWKGVHASARAAMGF